MVAGAFLVFAVPIVRRMPRAVARTRRHRRQRQTGELVGVPDRGEPAADG